MVGQQIPRGPATQSVNPVLQWNRALLVIVRTPGAQPATIHPTRSFAIMHAAIYDAVNTIDRTHKPYLVQLTGVSGHASLDAAAAAAHEVLVKLYPKFQASFDVQFQQSLAQITVGDGKAEGINIGQTVADRILALRINDGSNAQPIPFVFGTAQETTGQRHLISRRSLNSLIGPTLRLLPWRARISFVPDLLRR
jgi:hypothetical protein